MSLLNRMFAQNGNRSLGKGIDRNQVDSGVEFSTQGTTFRIFKAVGGTIIQTLPWNDHRNEIKTTKEKVPVLYVIHEGANLGEEISQILTREGLSR